MLSPKQKNLYCELFYWCFTPLLRCLKTEWLLLVAKHYHWDTAGGRNQWKLLTPNSAVMILSHLSRQQNFWICQGKTSSNPPANCQYWRNLRKKWEGQLPHILHHIWIWSWVSPCFALTVLHLYLQISQQSLWSYKAGENRILQIWMQFLS